MINKLESFFQRIKLISDTNIVNGLHLQEEVGELSTEIMIQSHLISKKSDEGVVGEAIDVVVCALAIIANEVDSLSDIEEYLDKKITKWENRRNGIQ
jgi:phosphoribosyl-ATP pyrophosphohydrolase